MTYYNPDERQEIRKKWIARMQDWHNSGLSGAAWCKEKEIAYHQFTYWKSRIDQSADQKLGPHSFVEIDDHPESSGIEVILANASIHLSKDFDSLTFLRCLQALRESKC